MLKNFSLFSRFSNFSIEWQRKLKVITISQMFLHIFMCLESDDWFNIPKTRRLPLLDKLHKAKVTACFFGHYHGNVVSNYEGMPLVVTTAIGWQRGTDTHGFRIVKVTDADVSHQFVRLEESVDEIVRRTQLRPFMTEESIHLASQENGDKSSTVTRATVSYDKKLLGILKAKI